MSLFERRFEHVFSEALRCRSRFKPQVQAWRSCCRTRMRVSLQKASVCVSVQCRGPRWLQQSFFLGRCSAMIVCIVFCFGSQRWGLAVLNSTSVRAGLVWCKMLSAAFPLLLSDDWPVCGIFRVEETISKTICKKEERRKKKEEKRQEKYIWDLGARPGLKF